MTPEKASEGDAQKPRIWYANGSRSELDYQYGLGLHRAELDDIRSATVTGSYEAAAKLAAKVG